MNAVVTQIKSSPAESRLKAVPPKAAEPSKPKIIEFGKPGVGKTWAALDFPSVYYIDTEGGADLGHYTDKLEKSGGMYLGPEQGSLSFETVIEQIQALATEKHNFRTVVIDSITKLFMQEIAREAERLGDKNAFGADKKPAVSYMRRLVSWLQRLDMNVILIAHEKAVWGKDEKGNQAVIGETFDAWDKLEYELHLCLHIVKQGTSRYAQVRKTRLIGFPEGDRFVWSYQNFAERYGKDIIEKQATQLVLASPEQMTEFNRLIDTVKLPEGLTDKWLKAARVEVFSDMDGDKMAKCIDELKKRIAA